MIAAEIKNGAPRSVIEALAGSFDRPSPTLSAAFADFLDMTTDRLAGKSEAQIHKWRLPRDRAVRNFIAVVGDLPIAEITRENALTFRRYWRDRIDADGVEPGSANKDFSHLSDIVRTWCDLKAVDIDNPFVRLRFREKAKRETYPFSTEWIRLRLLAWVGNWIGRPRRDHQMGRVLQQQSPAQRP